MEYFLSEAFLEIGLVRPCVTVSSLSELRHVRISKTVGQVQEAYQLYYSYQKVRAYI